MLRDSVLTAHLDADTVVGLSIGAVLGVLAVFGGLWNIYAVYANRSGLKVPQPTARPSVFVGVLATVVGAYFVWVTLIWGVPEKRRESIDAQREAIRRGFTAHLGHASAAQFLRYVRAGVYAIDDDVDNGTMLANFVETGRQDAARALLDAGASPEAHADGQYSPLVLAISHNDPEMVRLLLAAHANPNTPADERPIFAAVDPDTAEDVPQSVSGSFGPYVDHAAEIVGALVAAGADLNVRDDRSYTPAMIAAAEGRCDVLAALLAGAPDLTLRATTGESARDWADSEGHPDCVRLLDAAARTGAERTGAERTGAGPSRPRPGGLTR